MARRAIAGVTLMLLAAGVVVAATATVAASPQQASSPGRAQAMADFNDDGFGDFAVGVFAESVGSVQRAGAVNVIYGSSTGLQVTGTGGPDDQFWTDNDVDGSEGAETGDGFGASLEAGDFDGDGVADLAIGIRAEDVGSVGEAGAVAVLYGTAVAGLTSTGSQYWTQDSPGVRDTADPGDHMGSSLADGDFNGDGFGDLAIGTDFEGFGALTKVGAVNVLYGSANGLQATSPDDQMWTQNSRGVRETSETNDRFGRELETGDFNGDGMTDLAIGTHFESAQAVSQAGSVNVLYGSTTGLQATGTGGPDDQLWTQGRNGVKDVAETDDRFGSALAVGDFNGDGFEDLGVGIRLEDLGTDTDAGAVSIIYGTANGLQAFETGPDDQFFIQDDLAGQPGEGSEPDDWFGYNLSADDYDGDGFTDLTASARFEDVGAIFDGGAVNTIYGSEDGLTATGSQYWTQDSTSILDQTETSDEFGVWSDGADFDGDGFADVGVAVWLEDVGTLADAGAANVLYGSATGLTSAGNQYWHQNVTGTAGDGAQAGDLFGWNVAAT